MLDLTIIKKHFEDLLAKHHIDKSRLVNGNADYIYYQNGNDGTDFDYYANEMSCEFMCFYESSHYGAIKANIEKNGLRYYVYAEEDWSEILEKGFLPLPFDLKTACEHLLENFDNKDIYDAPILNWKLMTSYPLDDEEDEDEEDEDEEDEEEY